MKNQSKHQRPVQYEIHGEKKPSLVASTGMEIKFKNTDSLANFLHDTRLARQVINLQQLPSELLHKV